MTPHQLFLARVARQLKKERKRAKVNQAAAAAAIPMHRNAVSRWENGTNGIGLWEFVRYCEGLERRPESVLAEILAPAANTDTIAELRARLAPPPASLERVEAA
jgi:transcriptional regulator with XRE-family HTH domain